MSKQPTSKRQWRDGAAPSAKKTAKPFKSKARPKDETRKTASKPYGQKVSDDLNIRQRLTSLHHHPNILTACHNAAIRKPIHGSITRHLGSQRLPAGPKI